MRWRPEKFPHDAVLRHRPTSRIRRSFVVSAVQVRLIRYEGQKRQWQKSLPFKKVDEKSSQSQFQKEFGIFEMIHVDLSRGDNAIALFRRISNHVKK